MTAISFSEFSKQQHSRSNRLNSEAKNISQNSTSLIPNFDEVKAYSEQFLGISINAQVKLHR
jgi:hypothetical protein